LYAKVMRSIDPSLAKTPRERSARTAKRERLQALLVEGREIPRAHTYPGLGERWGRPYEQQTAIQIPGAYFQRMTEKIVRGIFFIEDSVLIEPPHAIRHSAVDDARIPSVIAMLDGHATVHARLPGLLVRRVVMPGHEPGSVFEITFWGQVKSYATVLGPDVRQIAAGGSAKP
jgi:hypothetical protein